jgi:hypothetical protein
MYAHFRPLAGVTIGNYMEVGDSIDYTHSQKAETAYYSPFVEWQISKHFSLELAYDSHTLDVDDGELFKAKLLQLDLAYQFNIRSRLSINIQSVDVNRNTELYWDNQDNDLDNDILASNKSLGSQLIYSYKINPQTLVYVGYSDNAVQNNNVQSMEKTDKTLFAKFSYLWQL